MYTNLRYWIIFHNASQLCSGPTAEASNGHPVIHKLRDSFNHLTRTWTAQTRFYSQSHGISLVTFLHEYVVQAPAAAASLKYHRTFSKHTCCLVLALNSTLCRSWCTENLLICKLHHIKWLFASNCEQFVVVSSFQVALEGYDTPLLSINLTSRAEWKHMRRTFYTDEPTEVNKYLACPPRPIIPRMMVSHDRYKNIVRSEYDLLLHILYWIHCFGVMKARNSGDLVAGRFQYQSIRSWIFEI